MEYLFGRFAMGGYDGGKIVSTVEVFDPRKGSWMMGTSMNSCRGYSPAVVFGDAIYAIGGLKKGDEILDTVCLLFPPLTQMFMKNAGYMR